MTFRNGGWVFALAAVVFVVLGGWQIQQLITSRGTPRIGDGTHPESYGFPLSPCLVDLGLVSGIGVPKEGLPRLDHPDLVAGVDHRTVKLGMRGGKYLVSGDRVVGVERNGVARAYPLSVLAWHEVVNDTLGGEPIVVTYAPLCDAAVVFDRRVGAEVVEFGFSGLVYNSNLLLYDRRDTPERESLWSQLQARAIAGPAAANADSLAVLPFVLARWEDWLDRVPHTTLVKPTPKMALKYNEAPYTSYYGNDVLHDVPISPVPPEGERRKMPVLVVSVRDDQWVVPLPLIAAAADDRGEWVRSRGGTSIRFRYHPDPPCATAELNDDPDAPLRVVPTFWFAWVATHPGARLVGAP